MGMGYYHGDDNQYAAFAIAEMLFQAWILDAETKDMQLGLLNAFPALKLRMISTFAAGIRRVFRSWHRLIARHAAVGPPDVVGG